MQSDLSDRKGEAGGRIQHSVFQSGSAEDVCGFTEEERTRLTGDLERIKKNLTEFLSETERRGYIMKQYVKYAKPLSWRLYHRSVSDADRGAGDILMPKMMSLIINHGVAAHDTGYILRMGLYMVLVAAVMAVSGIGGAYFSAKGID